MSSRPTTRRAVAGVTALAVTAALVAAAAPAANASPPLRPTFGGTAFGSFVKLGSTVQSERTAAVPLCTRQVGATHSDTTAGTNIPNVGMIGAVKTRVATRKLPGGARRVTSMSRTATTTLFGLLHLDAVSTKAQATSKNGKTMLTGGATFLNFKVNGQNQGASPSPNQTIDVPGLLHVVLNQQIKRHINGNPEIIVNALHITVGKNNPLGLPVGDVIVGHAVASLHSPTHRLVKGGAYATNLNVANGLVRVGRVAPRYMPCGGTVGAWRRNATAAVDIPSVLHLSAATSRVRSYEHGAKTVAIAESRIAGIRLFGGMVSVGAITAHAVTSRVGGHLSRSSAGTTIARLSINGTAQPISTDPNQSFSIPGLGTLWVHRVVKGRIGQQVYALQIVLGQATGGLPAGAVIDVGAAKAAVFKR